MAMLSLPYPQERDLTTCLHQPVVNPGIILAFLLALEVLSISSPGVAHLHTCNRPPLWGCMPCIPSRHSPSQGFSEWVEGMSSLGHEVGRGFEGTLCLPFPHLSAYASCSPSLSFPRPFLVFFGTPHIRQLLSR